MQSELQIDERFCRDICCDSRTENQYAFSCVQPPFSALIPCNSKSKHWLTRAPPHRTAHIPMTFPSNLPQPRPKNDDPSFPLGKSCQLISTCRIPSLQTNFSVLSSEQLTLVSETPQISLCGRGNSLGTLGTPWELCVSWEEVSLLFLSSIPFAKGNAFSTVIDSHGLLFGRHF